MKNRNPTKLINNVISKINLAAYAALTLTGTASSITIKYMKIKKTLVLAIAGSFAAMASVASAATLFVDNFNLSPSSTNLNDGLESRQSGGLISSEYTFPGTDNLVGDDGGTNLRLSSGGTSTLNHDFANDLGSDDFSLSFDFKANATSNTWSSIYLKSATDDARGKSPIHVYFHSDNTVVNLIRLQHGTGSSVVGTSINNTTVAAALGTAFSINDWHNYSFVVSASSATSGTYDFLVDGTIVASDLAYQFSDSESRQIEFVGPAEQISNWDNLTLIPEPAATAGLLGLGTTLVMAVRRRRRA